MSGTSRAPCGRAANLPNRRFGLVPRIDGRAAACSVAASYYVDGRPWRMTRIHSVARSPTLVASSSPVSLPDPCTGPSSLKVSG